MSMSIYAMKMHENRFRPVFRAKVSEKTIYDPHWQASAKKQPYIPNPHYLLHAGAQWPKREVMAVFAFLGLDIDAKNGSSFDLKDVQTRLFESIGRSHLLVLETKQEGKGKAAPKHESLTHHLTHLSLIIEHGINEGATHLGVV